MADFNEHIQHSKSNIDFLFKVNSNISNSWDWQVTVCFYSALHLLNAHIVSKIGKNYLSHSQVSEVINPYNKLSLAKLDEETYISYNKLFQLSRRSRYLLNENFKKKDTVDIQPISITYSKHFKKSIYHLDQIMNFMTENYDVIFNRISINCVDTKGISYTNFET